MGRVSHPLQQRAFDRASHVGGREESRVARVGKPGADGSYLVDPASSHMLVSKIKPCMSKYKLLCIVKLRMAH